MSCLSLSSILSLFDYAMRGYLPHTVYVHHEGVFTPYCLCAPWWGIYPILVCVHHEGVFTPYCLCAPWEGIYPILVCVHLSWLFCTLNYNFDLIFVSYLHIHVIKIQLFDPNINCSVYITQHSSNWFLNKKRSNITSNTCILHIHVCPWWLKKQEKRKLCLVNKI